MSEENEDKEKVVAESDAPFETDAKEEKKEEVEPHKETIDGVVLYTDGSGSGHQAGMTGAGIHGYTYKNEPTKKGLGLGKWKASAYGYDETLEKESEELVTIVEYLDVTMSTFYGTNNTAELKAGIHAMEIAADLVNKGIKKVILRADSEYVIKGTKYYLDSWSKNDWQKRTGGTIANVELWKRALAARDKLKETGVDFDIIHVKGHSNEPGNDAADKNALIGRVLNKELGVTADKDVIKYKWTEPGGYWKVDVSDKISMLQNSVIIFDAAEKVAHDNTIYELFTNANGEGTNDLGMFGMPDESACYGIVELKEHSSYLNDLCNHQNVSVPAEVTDMIQGSIYCGIHIRTAFNPGTLSLYKRQGLGTIIPTGDLGELKVLMADKLTEVLYPARMAISGVGQLASLRELFDLYKKDSLKDHAFYKIVDVTELVYDIDKTKKGDVYKLKESLNSTTARLDLCQTYPELRNESGINAMILSFGSDMPKREIVYSAAKQEPKAFVVYWDDSGARGRAFVLDTNEGIGLWHNPWRSVL